MELHHPNYRAYRILSENHGFRLQIALELLSYESSSPDCPRDGWTRPDYECDILQFLLPAEDFTPLPELRHTPTTLSPFGFALQPHAAR